MQVTRSWATKHRPRKWSDVVGQEDALQSLQGMIKRSSLPSAIMYSGPSGCGKTTLARLFGRYLNCETNNACGKCASCLQNPDKHADVEELNGAEKRGIDDVRLLISKSKFMPRHNVRIMLLDEAHMLTPHAIETLLKELEEPASHTLWMICTTEPEKFKDTFLMRCAKITVGFPDVEQMSKRLRLIAKREKIEFDPQIVEACVQSSHGHVREAITLLEQAANVLAVNGDVSKVVQAVSQGATPETAAVATRMMLGLLSNSAGGDKLVAKAAFDMTDCLQTVNACMYYCQYLIGVEVSYTGRNLWHSPANKLFAQTMKSKLKHRLTLGAMLRAQRKLTTLRGVLHTVAGPELGLVITHLTEDRKVTS